MEILIANKKTGSNNNPALKKGVMQINHWYKNVNGWRTNRGTQTTEGVEYTYMTHEDIGNQFGKDVAPARPSTHNSANNGIQYLEKEISNLKSLLGKLVQADTDSSNEDAAEKTLNRVLSHIESRREHQPGLKRRQEKAAARKDIQEQRDARTAATASAIAQKKINKQTKENRKLGEALTKQTLAEETRRVKANTNQKMLEQLNNRKIETLVELHEIGEKIKALTIQQKTLRDHHRAMKIERKKFGATNNWTSYIKSHEQKEAIAKAYANWKKRGGSSGNRKPDMVLVLEYLKSKATGKEELNIKNVIHILEALNWAPGGNGRSKPKRGKAEPNNGPNNKSNNKSNNNGLNNNRPNKKGEL